MCDGGEGGGGHGGSGNGEEGGGDDDSGTGGGGEGGVGGIGGGGGGCAGEGGSSGEVQPEPTRVDRWLDGRPPEGWGDSNSTGRPSAMRTDTRRTDTAATRLGQVVVVSKAGARRVAHRQSGHGDALQPSSTSIEKIVRENASAPAIRESVASIVSGARPTHTILLHADGACSRTCVRGRTEHGGHVARRRGKRWGR